MSILLIISVIPTAFAANDKTQNDEETTTPGEEATKAANELYELGLLRGTGTDENGDPVFNLDHELTRMEAITMLVRLLGKEEEAQNGTWETPFTDVPNWAKPYVGYAYANGLTNGVSPTKFGSKDTVTATQYLTFVLRALGYSSETDFKWDRAWELTDKIGLTDGNYNAETTEFLRADVSIISFDALDQPVNGTEQKLLTKIQSKDDKNENDKNEEDQTGNSNNQGGSSNISNTPSNGNQNNNSQGGGNQNNNNQNGGNQNGGNQNGDDRITVPFTMDITLKWAELGIWTAGDSFVCYSGESFTVTVLYKDAPVTDYTVKVSEPTVCSATKEQDGSLTLKAESAGESVVTIITKDGYAAFKLHAEKALNVSETSLTLHDDGLISPQVISSGTLFQEEQNISLYFTVFDGDSKIIRYNVSVSDENVCRASKSGDGGFNVETVGEGDTVLTITTENSSASFTFHVGNPTNLALKSEGDELAACETFNCDPGDKIAFTVYDGSTKVTDYDVAIEKEDVCKATIKEDGTLELEALSIGETILAIATENDTTWFVIHVGAVLTLDFEDDDYEYPMNPNDIFGCKIGDTVIVNVYDKGVLITDYDFEVKVLDEDGAEPVCEISKNEDGSLVCKAVRSGFCEVTIITKTGEARFYFNGLEKNAVSRRGLSIGFYFFANPGESFGCDIGGSLTVKVFNGDEIITDKDGYTVTLSDPTVCSYTIKEDGSLKFKALSDGDCKVTITIGDETTWFNFHTGTHDDPSMMEQAAPSNIALGWYVTIESNNNWTVTRSIGKTFTATVYNDEEATDDYEVEVGNPDVCVAYKDSDGNLVVEAKKPGWTTVTVTRGSDYIVFRFITSES
jgi:hypothetical protein